MNIIDVLITVSLVIAIGHGWRLGVLRGVFGLAGLVLGAWLALQSAPIALDAFGLGTVTRIVSGIGIIAAAAVIGESLGFRVGDILRRTILWQPMRLIDSVLGSAFRVTSLMAIIWLLTSALAPLPDQGVVHQVRGSQIVSVIDEYAPAAADKATATLRSAMQSSGFPVVFSDVTPQPKHSVAPADPVVLADPEVQATYGSIFKVEAESDACGERMSGSGFVYATDRIMTNAHVVAGSDAVVVWSMAAPDRYPARVVYIDPKLDVAILAVPGLRNTPIEFGDDARAGTEGVVPGFTGGDPLSPDVARVSDVLIARGHDIYGVQRVDREIFVLRAAVAAGDSGAPLIGLDGRVLGLVFAAGTDDPDTGYALTLPAIGRAAALGRASDTPVDTGVCTPIA